MDRAQTRLTAAARAPRWKVSAFCRAGRTKGDEREDGREDGRRSGRVGAEEQIWLKASAPGNGIIILYPDGRDVNRSASSGLQTQHPVAPPPSLGTLIRPVLPSALGALHHRHTHAKLKDILSFLHKCGAQI